MDPREHVDQARFLLNNLDHPLISGNRQLLSEVLWGAATQMVKAVAKNLDLPCGNHRELFRAVREVGANIEPDANLIREFGRVGQLHENFYDGDMSVAEIADRREVTLIFIGKMQRILAAN